jgi:predicted enzyme related to lactoylglutathione lyase
VDWKIGVIVIPVSDIDRAKAFYVDRAGFDVHVDFSSGEDFRVVHLTPRGSECSIALMKNPEAAGTVNGVHLGVSDIDAALAELKDRGMEVSEPFHFEEGSQVPGPDPQRADYGTFLSFSDPDGNGWLVQEVGRVQS